MLLYEKISENATNVRNNNETIWR